MKENEIVTNSFREHLGVLKDTLEKHADNIVAAADLIFDCYNKGGKVLLFGNGGSAADSQHIAAEFVGRFLSERRSLPAIALTTDTSILTAVGNDYGFDRIFQRQVESLVNSGDVIIALSTSGNSENVIEGVLTAREKGAKVIVLSSQGGGRLHDHADILIDIPSKETPRIQEMHILVGHTICNIVETVVMSRKEGGK